MRSLYISMGYYKTYMMEVDCRGRVITIKGIDSINCGNNFLVGRLNKVDEFADYLSLIIKSKYKKSINDIVLILPNDFLIESVVDGNKVEERNVRRGVQEIAERNRHMGMSNMSITKLGKNSYNEIYLISEYDGRRFDTLLDALKKEGIIIKQAVTPTNCIHHLTRLVSNKFEVVNSSNSGTNVMQTSVLCINCSVNRTMYYNMRSNLPLEVRNGMVTFMPVIDRMSSLGVSFTKTIRLLNLEGVVGLDDAGDVEDDRGEVGGLVNISDLFDSDDTESNVVNKSEVEEVGDKITKLLLDDRSTKVAKGKISNEARLRDYLEHDKIDDNDINLSDLEYRAFESTLLDVLSEFRAEIQKTINYFSSAYNSKLSDVVVVSNDINGIGEKLSEYSGLTSHNIDLNSGESLDVDDYTIINGCDKHIDDMYTTILGAVLSNNSKSNIYE